MCVCVCVCVCGTYRGSLVIRLRSDKLREATRQQEVKLIAIRKVKFHLHVLTYSVH